MSAGRWSRGALALVVAIVLLLPTRTTADVDKSITCVHHQKLVKNYIHQVRIDFADLLPVTQDVLAEHHVRSFFAGRDEVEILLDDIRSIELPPADDHGVEYLDLDRSAVFNDPRSRIDRLWRIDEITVAAADLAYEIEYVLRPDLTSTGYLRPDLVAEKLPGYTAVAIYADTFSGFAGVVLEPKSASSTPAHRIYALAGSHVFYHTDLRTWASGLTMASAQFVSGAALRMIRDAAAYAQAGEAGGEVFVTGQSQGGLTSQGFGYLLQILPLKP